MVDNNNVPHTITSTFHVHTSSHAYGTTASQTSYKIHTVHSTCSTPSVSPSTRNSTEALGLLNTLPTATPGQVKSCRKYVSREALQSSYCTLQRVSRETLEIELLYTAESIKEGTAESIKEGATY